ncbi:hypothetical protein NXS19_001052 [Fusarium pseudograminearum]|nr:hypothetical protein NXS19_001052 [Fusarium pseudograminearum]
MPGRHAKRLQGWSPQAEAKPALHVDGRGRSCGCADGHVDLICIALSTSGGPCMVIMIVHWDHRLFLLAPTSLILIRAAACSKKDGDRSKPSQRWKGERDLPISEIITPRICSISNKDRGLSRDQRAVLFQVHAWASHFDGSCLCDKATDS